MARLCAGTALILTPSKNTSPAVGVWKPPIMRRVVVLPHPLGPSSVRNSLSWIFSVMLSSTTSSSKRHGAVHQADQLLGHVSSPISFQLTACQLPRSHSRRCPQQRDSWRSRRGFTDSEIHYIRLPIKCQWILSKISVKSPRRKTGKARPGQGKLGVRRSEGRSRRTGGDHREKPGKYSVTKSTCSTWNCCPSRGASAPASVVKQNSSR